MGAASGHRQRNLGVAFVLAIMGKLFCLLVAVLLNKVWLVKGLAFSDNRDWIGAGSRISRIHLPGC
jgi:hypothetical protein